MRNLLSLVVVLAACGDDGGSSIDARPAGDGGGSAACTGALYDRCTADADCQSNMCRQFNNLNAMLCTQACTDASTCPAGPGGGAATCPGNSMICRPAAASTCTPE